MWQGQSGPVSTSASGQLYIDYAPNGRALLSIHNPAGPVLRGGSVVHRYYEHTEA